MYGALGSWGWPQADQTRKFEHEYQDVYLPLVRKVPYVVGLELFKADESGRESDLYRVGVMWFDDQERWRAASATDEWSAMFACCNDLIERYQIPMRFAYVHDELKRLP